MSDDATQALRDTRLMLEGFAASPWRHLQIACGTMRLSISRMTSVERATWATATALTSSAQVERVGETLLTAPHVATVRSLAPAGSAIRAGEVYARLEVLDAPIELFASNDMRVVSLLRQPGEFVEFAAPLMAVALFDG